MSTFSNWNGPGPGLGSIPGPPGEVGPRGNDGLTPRIGPDGNWWIGSINTGIRARGPIGQAGLNGINGLTPQIGANGNWWIGVTDTGVRAEGQGPQGPAGDSPRIVAGIWWVGDVNTGVAAQGASGIPGAHGKTPYIGGNGNWWIGTTDLNVKAQGPQGLQGIQGQQGIPGLIGPAGKGIQQIQNFFTTTDNLTQPPIHNPPFAPNPVWQPMLTGLPFDTTNKYLWRWQRIIYTDGTTNDNETITNQVFLSSVYGSGRGVISMTQSFMVTDSHTKPTETTPGWLPTLPHMNEIYRFLWQRLDTLFSDDVIETTITIAAIRGRDGANVAIQGESEDWTTFLSENIVGKPGDAYLILNPAPVTITVWQESTSSWALPQPFQGPSGIDGSRMLGVFADPTEVPPTLTGNPGDFIVVGGVIYVWEE